VTELRPAIGWSRTELAALFTAGFENYVVPMQVDEPAFSRMVDIADIDLERSLVAVRGDEPVAIGLLAVRGDEASIAGLGVVDAARRSGLGRQVMEALLVDAAGLDVTIEVIESNEPALRLYEALGFVETRKLELWALDAQPPPSRATAANLDDAHALVRRHRHSPEPWQRGDATLAHLRRRDEGPDALALGEDGAVLFAVRGPSAAVFQLGARDEEVACELLAGVRARADAVRFMNVPEGDPASAALAALGAKLELRQLELAPSR
jgi:ribosomal protein S18 acetylase RimI-like enzyme